MKFLGCQLSIVFDIKNSHGKTLPFFFFSLYFFIYRARGVPELQIPCGQKELILLFKFLSYPLTEHPAKPVLTHNSLLIKTMSPSSLL